jgi:proline iminopeptidase
MATRVDASHAEGMLEVGDGQRLSWEVVGNPEGHPCGRPARRSWQWHLAAVRRAVRPDAVPRRCCSTSVAAGAAAPTPAIPTRRWRPTPPRTSWRTSSGSDPPRHRPVGRARTVVGVHPGARLRAATSGTRQRPGPGHGRDGHRREVEWITRDMGRFVPGLGSASATACPSRTAPATWRRVRPPAGRADDPAVREQAAHRLVRLGGHPRRRPRREPSPARSTIRRSGWRSPGSSPTTGGMPASWRRASCCGTRRVWRGIPGTLVHGRLDLSSPVDVPWQLHHRWPGSELVVVDEGRHSGGHGMLEALRRATDRGAAR